MGAFSHGEETITMAKVSIVIKALNEESNIGRAIESSLSAVADFNGEVILADSLSTDKTIQIAKQFPISIVQLEHADDRSCGIGPQLGYQYSSGEYVYILDGDMELQAPFLKEAIATLDSQPAVAGIGGYIHEMRAGNLELKGRLKRVNRMRPKDLLDVECLNGGGLYRRSAIDDVGYFSDRNLHAFEEYDLGARLRVNGWRLVSLEDKAADHFSYAKGTWRLLWHRIRSGRFLSSGELFRAAVGGNYVRRVLREVRIVPIAIGVWLYWGMVIFASYRLSSAAMPIIALGVPVVVMALRTHSLTLGCFSVLTWHLSAVGFWLGLIGARKLPSSRVDSKILKTGSSDLAPIEENKKINQV
jgi:glycosyltransferase involved in cell wall biosynthesis